mgnify:CR=1 FL=1
MNSRPLSRLQASALVLVVASLLFPLDEACAGKFTTAEINKVVNDVKLLLGSQSSKPASAGSVINGKTAVRTGQKSRTELEFPDESIVRLGSNSVFSFLEGKREVNLEQGTLLMQVPKKLGRTSIRTASISAAITGTTIFIEYAPQENGPGTIKIIVIEGSLEYSLNSAPNEKMELGPGEMVAFPADLRQLPKKFSIDLVRLVKTSQLMAGGMGPLPMLGPVEAEVIEQKTQKTEGQFVSSVTRERQGLLARIVSGKVINQTRVAEAPQASPIELPTRPDRPPPGSGIDTSGSSNFD